MGEMKKRENTALALIRIGMLAMTSPCSPTCVSITCTQSELITLNYDDDMVFVLHIYIYMHNVLNVVAYFTRITKEKQKLHKSLDN